MITFCSNCCRLYQDVSQEQTNNPNGLCFRCASEENNMNLAMIQMLQEGDALDVSKIGSEIEPGVYQLTTFIDGIDYCDPSKDLWIWSIGKNLKSGLIYASMDTRYYFNDDYECLWLR